MTAFEDALTRIAKDLKVDPPDLIAYAAEDTVGGYNVVPWQSSWPMGSMYEVEGKILYAVIRAMKPEQVVEIGVWHGCSTTHILQALHQNKKGHLTSFDIEGIKGKGPDKALRDRWTFHHQDADYGMKELGFKADLVFEDGYHFRKGTETTLFIAERWLSPRVVMVHDSEHVTVGSGIKEALYAVYGNRWHSVVVPPSDCGIAWRVK